MHPQNLFLDESSDWHAILAPILAGPDGQALQNRLAAERASNIVYPPAGMELRALALTPLAQTKVIIIGQDPYHGPGQAQGLCFSVPDTVPAPPSLRNIHKALALDLGVSEPTRHDLTPWAHQGVLLWNTTLTVRAATPLSHAKLGWDIITNTVLAALASRDNPPIFVLWGAHAANAAAPFLTERHDTIRSVHPSPLSAHRGFFDHRPFSTVNGILRLRGESPIDWLDGLV
jgi:uracil-DNA glycosylase